MRTHADSPTLVRDHTERTASAAAAITDDRPAPAAATGCPGHDQHGPPTGRIHRLARHLRQPVVRTRLAVLGGLATASGVVATVNPAGDAPFPQCPTRALLGFDCPACGGLRGTHALVNGNIADALDYNLLLPLLLLTLAVPVVLWALPILGRASPRLTAPRWLVPVLIAVFGVFSVVRNLPFEIFEPLAADLTR